MRHTTAFPLTPGAPADLCRRHRPPFPGVDFSPAELNASQALFNVNETASSILLHSIIHAYFRINQRIAVSAAVAAAAAEAPQGPASHGTPPHRILHGPLRGSPDISFCDDVPRAVLLRQLRHGGPATSAKKHGVRMGGGFTLSAASGGGVSSMPTAPCSAAAAAAGRDSTAINTHDSCSEKLRKPAAMVICCSCGSPDSASAASWSSVRPRRLQASGQGRSTASAATSRCSVDAACMCLKSQNRPAT